MLVTGDISVPVTGDSTVTSVMIMFRSAVRRRSMAGNVDLNQDSATVLTGTDSSFVNACGILVQYLASENPDGYA